MSTIRAILVILAAGIIGLLTVLFGTKFGNKVFDKVEDEVEALNAIKAAKEIAKVEKDRERQIQMVFKKHKQEMADLSVKQVEEVRKLADRNAPPGKLAARIVRASRANRRRLGQVP